MSDRIDRRGLLKGVTGLGAITGIGAYTLDRTRNGDGSGALPDGSDDFAEETPSKMAPPATGLFNQFYKEETAADLPEPDDKPAIGLTLDGWYEWPTDGDDWQPAWTSYGTDADPVNEVVAERINERRYPAKQAGGDDEAQDGPQQVSGTLDEGGRYMLGAGQYETSGLPIDPDVDFERTAVYLEGDGIRTTTLTSDGTDSSVYELDNDDTGNFGGLNDLTIHGSGGGEGPTEPLVYISGVIDQLIENVILRYSGGDLVRVEESASGLRLHNSWIENTSGYGVWTTTGTRGKLTGLHIISCGDGGISTGLSNSQFSNISVQNCPTGIEFRNGKNQLSNVYLSDSSASGMAPNGGYTTISNVFGRRNERTLDLNSFFTTASNVISKETDKEGVRIREDNTTCSNVVVVQFSGDSNRYYGVAVEGDENTVSDVTVAQSEDEGRYTAPNLLRIDGDRNVVDGIKGVDANRNWNVAIDGTENILRGVQNVSPENLDDDGVRTLFNGRGTNDGDPSQEGEWNGHGEYAAAQNALVEDTSGGSLYRARFDGSWITVA